VANDRGYGGGEQLESATIAAEPPEGAKEGAAAEGRGAAQAAGVKCSMAMIDEYSQDATILPTSRQFVQPSEAPVQVVRP
jgi:hypothetical protein